LKCAGISGALSEKSAEKPQQATVFKIAIHILLCTGTPSVRVKAWSMVRTRNKSVIKIESIFLLSHLNVYRLPLYVDGAPGTATASSVCTKGFSFETNSNHSALTAIFWPRQSDFINFT
jgi:hypothetical protein